MRGCAGIHGDEWVAEEISGETRGLASTHRRKGGERCVEGFSWGRGGHSWSLLVMLGRFGNDWWDMWGHRHASPHHPAKRDNNMPTAHKLAKTVQALEKANPPTCSLSPET